MKPLLIFLFCFNISSAIAQNQMTYESEKGKLYTRLTARNISSSYTSEIERFYNQTCDSLIKADLKIDDEPIKSTLTKLFQASNIELDKRTISILRIPSLNANFMEVVGAYKRTPLVVPFRLLGINRTRILAAAFKGTPAGDTIRSYVEIREMMYSPVLIPGRISKTQFAPYRDTMLHYLASMEPELYLTELKTNYVLQDLTNTTKHKTVKAIASLKDDENLVEMLPFGLAIFEQRTSTDVVRKLINKPSSYYSAFTKEMLELNISEQQDRRDFLRSFTEDLNHVLCENYVNPINELHEKPDNVRYQILNNISPVDLYFVILGGEGMFYTSSFLYVFNKFIKLTEKEGLDAFFERTGYYHFGEFLTIVSDYGLLDKLASKMDPEKFVNVLTRYMRKTIKTQMSDRELILQGMNLSEVFSGLRSNEKIKVLLLEKLDELSREQAVSNMLIQRMYVGFSDILLDENNSKLKEVEKLYDVLPVQRLKTNETIVQVALFYDDVDGTASYANYLQLFPLSKWSKTDKGNYIILKSKEGNSMIVYCNKPNTKIKDNAAQDEMLQAIADENQEITSFLHRGHSYHLYKSLRKLPSTIQFVYLGSCGGYNDVAKVFLANPDAHIISTRSIGSKYVNDPILNKITNEVLADKNLEWNELWKGFETSFTQKSTRDLFASYIPPNRYIGIMFIREVFNF